MDKWYEEIVSARKEKLLSAKDLAKLIGITPVYMCRIEKGRIPSLKILKKICKILNLNYAKMAEELGYSKEIKKITNKLFTSSNIQDIVLQLYDLPSQDFILVLDMIKNFSNLTQKEKDIIRLIIST